MLVSRRVSFHYPLEPRKNPLSFCYTGWLIGILVMVYYNPYITGEYNPLYNPTNQGFFHCSLGILRSLYLKIFPPASGGFSSQSAVQPRKCVPQNFRKDLGLVYICRSFPQKNLLLAFCFWKAMVYEWCLDSKYSDFFDFV